MTNVVVTLNNTKIIGEIVNETEAGIVYVKSGNDTFKFFRGIQEIQEYNELENFFEEEMLDWEEVEADEDETAYIIKHSAEYYEYTVWVYVLADGYQLSTWKGDEETDCNQRFVKSLKAAKNYISKVTAR